jgi:hypothetical protein
MFSCCCSSCSCCRRCVLEGLKGLMGQLSASCAGSKPRSPPWVAADCLLAGCCCCCRDCQFLACARSAALPVGVLGSVRDVCCCAGMLCSSRLGELPTHLGGPSGAGLLFLLSRTPPSRDVAKGGLAVLSSSARCSVVLPWLPPAVPADLPAPECCGSMFSVQTKVSCC